MGQLYEKEELEDGDILLTPVEIASQETCGCPEGGCPIEVIFNPPYTIINWSDGSKSMSKAKIVRSEGGEIDSFESDNFDFEVGFYVAFANHYIDGGCISKNKNTNLIQTGIKHLIPNG